MGMGKTTVSAGNAVSGCMAATTSDAGVCAWTEFTVARDLLPLLDLGWELLLGWELPLALLWRDPCPPPFLLSYLRLSLRSSSRSRLRSRLEERPRSTHRSRALRSFRSWFLSPAPAACVGLVRDGRPQTRCCNGYVWMYQHPLRTPPRVSSDEAPILEDTDTLRRCHDPLPSMPCPS